jgi:thiamine biosynthesis lipoprotein
MKHLARFTILILLCALPTPAFSTLQEVREVHYQMGTFLELILWHLEPEVAKRIIREAAQEVHRLDEILSNFDPDSSVSRLNQQAGKGKTSVPAELYELLEIAQRFSATTSGDFDITVGPLMELWRETSSLGRLPDRDTLANVLAQVGYEKLKLYHNDREAELLLPGMKIDLGGIGKGYAVDWVADRFKAAGIRSALINFGGSSIYALGTPPGQQGWEIAIQGTDGRLRAMIHLRDMALSTSGSMGKFWTIGGKRYGHLIDPTNGMPVSESRMATVITSTATTAEALTKPLVLRGKTALRLVARFAGTEAIVMPENGPLFFSDGFKAKTRWQEIPRS